MAQYLVGLDGGTTGCKTCIFDLDGKLVGSDYREYPSYYPEERAFEEVHSWEKEPVAQQAYTYGDTICLQQLPDREPYLSGRVNGEDIMIRLDNLPLTIGKMTGRVDYVISDSTVSKIHARIAVKSVRAKVGYKE